MLEFELVLPAYNEGRSLENLISRTVEAATEAGLTAEQFQLVVVENGSTDNSFQFLKELKSGAFGKWFRVVQVKVNQGYGFGLWSGLSTTTAPYVAWSHADMQCPPKDAFKALEVLKSQGSSAGLIKGVRRGRNWKDRFVSRVFELFAWLFLGMNVYEINAQPKVFSRSLLQFAKNPPKTFAFDLYMLYLSVKNRFRISTIEVDFPPRIHGTSKWAATFFGRYKTILGIIFYMRTLSKTEGRL